MNYQKGIKNNNGAYKSYANRGMGLENEIEKSNQYYKLHDIAIIHKKPTPITISKVDYPSRINAVIKQAYFRTPSTTDYNGIYKGRYIDFDAKETKSKTSFPLDNIHKHQLTHLNSIYMHGGIGFLIVRFVTLNKTYYLSIEKILDFIKTNSRKSIPISYFETSGYLIKNKYNPLVDYIEVINEIYFKESSDYNG